jgi:hypothetical protein
MNHFDRSLRNATAFVLLVALLVTHSAFAVAACLSHVHAVESTVVARAAPDGVDVHEHAAHARHAAAPASRAEAHVHQTHAAHADDAASRNALCQIGCEAQAPSLNQAHAAAIPATGEHTLYVVAAAPARAFRPVAYVAPAVPDATAAPPPVPLTLVLSRLRS